MVNWYIEVNAILREMRERAFDAIEKIQSNDDSAAQLINDYLKRDYEKLERLWKEKFANPLSLGNLNRHIKFGTIKDYEDILKLDIPAIEVILEKFLVEEMKEDRVGFEKFLHPIVYKNAYSHFQNGNYREAVLNSIIGVFDLIRQKTGLTNDGPSLINTALSLRDPYLILSDLDDIYGEDDQKGFSQIFQGAYVGIRDPKSHTLIHDLNREKAAQYLIFASLLARRIEEAKLVKKR
jgi:uncharacterized protein (TIGR02391 family)